MEARLQEREMDRRKRIEEMDFTTMSVAQIATVVRKVFNSPIRTQVILQLDVNIIKPQNIHLFLNPEELLQIEEIFKAIDTDGSKSIDFGEIKEGFEAMEISINDEQLLAMTEEFDKNRDDVIDFREFAALLFRVDISLQQRKHSALESAPASRKIGFAARVAEADVPLVKGIMRARRVVWETFENPSSSCFAQLLGFSLLCVIISSCVLFMLESTPYVQSSDALMRDFESFETISVYTFSVEFVGRLLSCPSLTRFAINLLNWVDLVAILPFYVENFLIEDDAGAVGSSSSLKVIRLVRIFRLLKIGRYLRWLGVFVDTIEASLFPLGMVQFIILIGLVTLSSGTYFAERGTFNATEETFYVNYQGEVIESDFSSIPATFWFILSTITSAGYGNVVTLFPVGKFVAVLAAIFGILVLAIPISVISTNFRAEYDKMKTRQEIEQEQATKLNWAPEVVNREVRRNKHLSKVIKLSKKFAVGISQEGDNLHEHQLFAASVYKSCRNNQKRVFYEMKYRERDNRHMLIENLHTVTDEYLCTRELDVDARLHDSVRRRRQSESLNSLVEILDEIDGHRSPAPVVVSES